MGRCVFSHRQILGTPDFLFWVDFTLLRRQAQSTCSLLNEFGSCLRLRNVDGVAPLHFDNLGTGTRSHGSLRIGRNHLVVRRNQVPAGLGFPSRFAYLTAKCLDAPGNLRVAHERRQLGIYVRNSLLPSRGSGTETHLAGVRSGALAHHCGIQGVNHRGETFRGEVSGSPVRPDELRLRRIITASIYKGKGGINCPETASSGRQPRARALLPKLLWLLLKRRFSRPRVRCSLNELGPP
jgi:hypothetical protein